MGKETICNYYLSPWQLFAYGTVETGQVDEEDDAEAEGDDAHILGYGQAEPFGWFDADKFEAESGDAVEDEHPTDDKAVVFAPFEEDI